MRIAVTNHHRQIVGGTESYLNGLLPELSRRGHQMALWHEAAVSPNAATIDVAEHHADWSGLPAWKPHLIFNHGLQSAGREWGLADIAPVVHFAHNYHGTCISGEKTRKLPAPAPCPRRFGPVCLLQYFPRACGGLNPLVMLRDFRSQSRRLVAIRRARAVVVASSHMQAEYARHAIAPIFRAPLFTCPPQVAAPRTPARRVLFAGRMTVLKGAYMLAEAAAHMHDVEVTFAGDGPERARVERRLPHARFTGWLPQPALCALAREHDVLAMPVLWPEPFGLTGLELGLPVAAFAVGGIPDWLSDGVNGALAPGDPPQPENLARAIERCLHQPSMREEAVRRAREFTLERHLAVLLPVLEQCAS